MTLSVVPFPVDTPAALRFAEEALRSRLAPGEELPTLLPPIAAAIRSARAGGGLLRADRESAGIVTWESAGPIGTAVRLLYLSPAAANADRYREALSLAERSAGPVAFAPGPLAGLSRTEESSLMRSLGFAPYGRSEMALPPTAMVAAAPAPRGAQVRPVGPSDEPRLARLHERAYRDHLDRFLALEDIDPTRDAERQVRDYFSGRYGELLTPGSSLVSLDGETVAAVLSTQRAGQALIIDVMSDPAHQGEGYGRAALSDALAALRERGENVIVLNVTEGNDRAIRLYQRLGFVRTMGPTQEWYDARRIRVAFPPAPPP